MKYQTVLLCCLIASVKLRLTTARSLAQAAPPSVSNDSSFDSDLLSALTTNFSGSGKQSFADLILGFPRTSCRGGREQPLLIWFDFWIHEAWCSNICILTLLKVQDQSCIKPSKLPTTLLKLQTQVLTPFNLVSYSRSCIIRPSQVHHLLTIVTQSVRGSRSIHLNSLCHDLGYRSVDLSYASAKLKQIVLKR